MSNECPFCAEIQDNTLNRLKVNRIIYQTEHFFVLPTVGCLVENYLLIVSKQHLFSMCYIDDSIKKEFIELLNKFRALFLEKYGFPPIVFEHGASDCDSNKGGCCILHAHTHIVPYKLNKSKEMVATLELKRVIKYDDFFNIGRNNPYLFYINNENEMFIRTLTTSVVPSQIIRKWIAEDLNIADKWDWRQYPFDENIKRTLSLYENSQCFMGAKNDIFTIIRSRF